MTQWEKLKRKIPDATDEDLQDCLDTAKEIILSRRYPFGEYPTKENEEGINETYIENRYMNLQLRIAIELYNKMGAEGEESHAENGVTRKYENGTVSASLLAEITPLGQFF